MLYTSGYTENAIIHHGRLDEGVTLLSKPYRLSQLARAVRAAVGQPRAGSASPAPAAGTAVSTGGAAPPVGVGVLLVEDEEMVRLAMAASLEQRGHRVVAAASPSEALRLLDGDGAVDVLVTDFTLPEMTGAALIREALARRPGLAIVLASGHSIDAAELPGQPVTILLKPFHPQALQEAIEAALGLEAAVG